jgi:hypothetical protein
MIPASVCEAIDRVVTEKELREVLESPISNAERDEATSLRRWFMKRYPRAEERLAYIRQAYSRWRADIDRSSATRGRALDATEAQSARRKPLETSVSFEPPWYVEVQTPLAVPA